MYSVLSSSPHDCFAVLFFFFSAPFFCGFLQCVSFVCSFANSTYFRFRKFLTLFSLSEWSADCQADALRSIHSLIQVSAWSSCVSGFGVASVCSDCMVCGLFTLHAGAHTSRTVPNFVEVLAFLTLGLFVNLEQVVGVLFVLCL